MRLHETWKGGRGPTAKYDDRIISSVCRNKVAAWGYGWEKLKKLRK